MTAGFDDQITSASDAEARLGQGMARMRTVSVEGLDRLHTIETARLAAQHREVERLEDKLGPGHPRVATLKAHIEIGTRAARNLAVNAERGRTFLHPPATDRWIVHGHVRDPELRGLPGLTVALYDDAGWVERAGYACTDEAGYFRVEVVGAARRAPAESVEHGTESAGPVTDATGQPMPAAAEWFLRVKENDRSLYTDTQPLQPELGRIDYREIILDRARAVCAPPERVKRQ